MACLRSPALPFELIEHALDYVYDPDEVYFGNQSTLYNCMLTCRALVPRSRYLLFLNLHISSQPTYECLIKHIENLALMSCTRGLTIMDEPFRALWQLGTSNPPQYSSQAVQQLAPHLEHLQRLHIGYADWAHSGLHESVFLSLGLLTSVSSLELSDCKFESVHQFHRMLCVLSALTALKLRYVTWVDEPSGPSEPCRPLHLESLSMVSLSMVWHSMSLVYDRKLCQKLTWVVGTSNPLRALSVELRRHDFVLMKPVLERLGSSLEYLDVELCSQIGRDPFKYPLLDPVGDNFGIENNTSLKTFVLRYLDIASAIDILAHVTSTQLSTLILDVWIVMDNQVLSRSRDAFLAFRTLLTSPVLNGIEYIQITLCARGLKTREARRCLRRMYQMIPEWLAPIEARQMSHIRIVRHMFKWGPSEDEDGPYVEGDELTLPS